MFPIKKKKRLRKIDLPGFCVVLLFTWESQTSKVDVNGIMNFCMPITQLQ